MLDAAIHLPKNPRVSFLVRHRDDLRRHQVPMSMVYALAPLYDHWELPTQLLTMVLIYIATYMLWVSLVQPWINRRIGFVRLPKLRVTKASKKSKRQKIEQAAFYTTLFGLYILVGYFLHFNDEAYHYVGWMERTAGIWTFGALFLCVDRATDQENVVIRRVWNGVGAAVLVVAFGLTGAVPKGFPAMLVVLGGVNIVMALLDVALLLHFAATPVDGDMGDTHG